MNFYFPTPVTKAKKPHPIGKNDDTSVISTPEQHNNKLLQLLHRNTEINTLMLCVSKLSKSYLPAMLDTVSLVYLINGDIHWGMLEQVDVVLQSSKVIVPYSKHS